jgi:hypothetical protein
MDNTPEEQPSKDQTPPDSIPTDLRDQPTDDTTVKSAKAAIRLKLLKLYYYRELAKTVAVFMQTFKVEAVSLMAGISTLVLGWVQIKKWVVQSRHEIKDLQRENDQLEVKSAPHVAHKVKVTKSSSSSVGMGSGGGSSYTGARRTPVANVSDLPIEMVPTMGAVEKKVDTFASDPGFYGMMLTAVIFVFTLVKAVKRRFGGSNGSV